MLKAGEFGGDSRRQTKDEPGIGFNQKLLSAVGEHGDENEDRESARRGLRPDLPERLAKIPPVAARRGRRRGFDAEIATQATAKARAETTPVTATRRPGEYGSRKCPASGAVSAKPKIIITHTVVAAAARRERRDLGGERRQHIGSRRARASAYEQKP